MTNLSWVKHLIIAHSLPVAQELIWGGYRLLAITQKGNSLSFLLGLKAERYIPGAVFTT